MLPSKKLPLMSDNRSEALLMVNFLQNVEETTLHTPAGCEFDNALHVQLTIRPNEVLPIWVAVS